MAKWEFVGDFRQKCEKKIGFLDVISVNYLSPSNERSQYSIWNLSKSATNFHFCQNQFSENMLAGSFQTLVPQPVAGVECHGAP